MRRSIAQTCPSPKWEGFSVGQPQGSVPRHASGRERRRLLRWPVFWSAMLDSEDGDRSCLVLDFSPGGAKVRSSLSLEVGERIALRFHDAIRLFGKVAWRRGAVLGIEFRKDLPRPARLLEQPPAERALAS